MQFPSVEGEQVFYWLPSFGGHHFQLPSRVAPKRCRWCKQVQGRPLCLCRIGGHAARKAFLLFQEPRSPSSSRGTVNFDRLAFAYPQGGPTRGQIPAPGGGKG